MPSYQRISTPNRIEIHLSVPVQKLSSEAVVHFHFNGVLPCISPWQVERGADGEQHSLVYAYLGESSPVNL